MNAKKALSEVSSYPNLEFGINDINHIIVGSNDEIPDIQDHLLKVYGAEFNKNSKLLNHILSKVTSYETLKNDFFSH